MYAGLGPAVSLVAAAISAAAGRIAAGVGTAECIAAGNKVCDNTGGTAAKPVDIPEVGKGATIPAAHTTGAAAVIRAVGTVTETLITHRKSSRQNLSAKTHCLC